MSRWLCWSASNRELKRRRLTQLLMQGDIMYAIDLGTHDARLSPVPQCGVAIISGVFAMLAEVERDLISQRTKEALSARRAAGVRLGRPRGPGKSRLDRHEPEIRALLSNGSTLKHMAERYGCAPSTLSNWMMERGISRQLLVKMEMHRVAPWNRPGGDVRRRDFPEVCRAPGSE